MIVIYVVLTCVMMVVIKLVNNRGYVLSHNNNTVSTPYYIPSKEF
jgi:hypothetical protein